MDDPKRDTNKSKRSRTDHVKNIVQSYLQKRNYSSMDLQENSQIDQQINYSLLEKEISRPNSILYSCYNSDPIVIDYNFKKFVSWVKDLVKNKNVCHDIEYIVAPLFCHLYLDILKGGHSERAATFLKSHLPAIEKMKCDEFVRELIAMFAGESDVTCMVELYRGHKYFLELSPHSLDLLKKYVVENCHVVFLHVLQTWFDLQQVVEKDNECEERSDEAKERNGVCVEKKFQKILDVIHELEKEPKQIFHINVNFTKEPITCAAVRRDSGLLAYNQSNVVHLRSIHPYDPILGVPDCKEIKFTDHSKPVYAVVVSPDCTRLVTASEDSTLCFYDLTELKLIKTCTGHLGPVYCAAIATNSFYVVSGSLDTTARLWNIDTGQTLRVLVGHTQAVTCVDIHPNCLYIATGSSDRNVRLWSVDNGSPLRLFHGCKSILYALAFSPLGDVLATVSDDKKLKIWDILSTKVTSEIKFRGDAMNKIAWSGDGRQLCTGALDGALRVWEVNANHEDKNQEPSVCINVNGNILSLEYFFETFACAST